MSSTDEKVPYTSDAEKSPVVHHEAPKGFFYSPYLQVVLLGFVCFMCPGMFNAVNGLGGGGQIDPKVSANSNVAVYATFAVGAFFSGTINNVIGSRLTLMLGAIGYSLYIASYLALNIHPNAGAFNIAAGAILGVCAGLLWTAQGSLMMSYPTEQQKGRFISIFWIIFNLGAVIGACVATGINWSSASGNVSNGTYAAFIALSGVGIFIPLIMADPKKMVRSDGTLVVTPRHPSWKSEIVGLWLSLKTDPMVLLLFPMFFASNIFYTWQFNAFNGAVFNTRTRAFNSIFYWLSQMFGSLAIGLLLDNAKLSRRTRAFAGWFVLMVFVMFTHGWAYTYQKDYTRAEIKARNDAKIPGLDLHESGYAPRIVLYIFFGILDAMWQTSAYWLMGAMSNDATKLAHFSGFYKSLQSAGAAIFWRLDGSGVAYMNIFGGTWGLLAAGLLFMLPMIHLRVHEHQEETIIEVNGTEQVVRKEAVE